MFFSGKEISKLNSLAIGLIGIVVLLILICMGLHIGSSLCFVGFVGCVILTNFKATSTMIASTIYNAITNYSLVIIPLFIFMGLLAGSGNIAKRMFNGMATWFGKFKPGMGIATILGCTAFGAVCGSGVATAATFAKIAAPEMRRHGYEKRFAYGICSSGGAIGMLIPPSLLAVTYGALSGLPIGSLLIGGIGAGVAMAAVYIATIIIMIKLHPEKVAESENLKSYTLSEKIKALVYFWPIILCGGIVIIGIFSGVFTPTEAASIASFVMVIMVFIVDKKDAINELKTAFQETCTMSCMIFYVLAGAMCFSKFMVLSGISNVVVKALLSANMSNMALAAMLMILYFLLGCIMESVSMLSITIPTLAPVIVQLGINPIWFAIVVIAATQIGLTTPPVGSGAYAAKGAAEADVTIEDVFAGCIPFLIAAIPLFVIYFVFPQLITYLPSLL